jgi:hypothetical protein
MNSKKFFIVNPSLKEVYNFAFNTEKEAKELILKSKIHGLRVGSGYKLNALIKFRNINLNLLDIENLKNIAIRREKEEEERIKELNRRLNKVVLK